MTLYFEVENCCRTAGFVVRSIFIHTFVNVISRLLSSVSYKTSCTFLSNNILLQLIFLGIADVQNAFAANLSPNIDLFSSFSLKLKITNKNQ